MRETLKDVQKLRRSKRRNRRNTIALCMASALVATGVLWQLRLPGITASQTYCGFEEHEHIETCFQADAEPVLSCDYQTLGIHVHTQTCQDTQGNQLCGMADSVVHHHDEMCVDSNGDLRCTLPERWEHTHSDGCWQDTAVWDEGHIHTGDCFEKISTEELVCGREETAGHIHDASCFSLSETPLCGNEDPEHVHDDLCFRMQICELTQAQAHTHDASCFRTARGELLCTEEEREPGEIPGEPELICTRPELLIHSHGEGCYTFDETLQVQVLVCTQPEVMAHQHTQDCFLPGEPELLCATEEHIHTLACNADVTADLETSEQWEASLVQATLSGIWRDDLLAVAQTQMGYRPSEQNFAVREDGVTVDRYSRYGAWASDPYGATEITFLSFCMRYAGIPEECLSVARSWDSWMAEQDAAGCFRSIHEELPEPGDIILLDRNGDTLADTGAVLESLKDSAVEVIAYDPVQGVIPVEYLREGPAVLGCVDMSAVQKLFQPQVPPEDPLVHEVRMFTDETFTSPRAEEIPVTVYGELPEGAEIYGWPLDLALEDVPTLWTCQLAVVLEDGTVCQPEQPLIVTVGAQALAAKADDARLEIWQTWEESPFVSIGCTEDEAGVCFEASSLSGFALVDTSVLDSIAEPGGDPMIDDSWLHYWSSMSAPDAAPVQGVFAMPPISPFGIDQTGEQIVSGGGSNENTADGVYISKTIEPTEIENVFDITLLVNTTSSLEELYSKPQMDVVIVMDISNTMNAAFGGTTRYLAAVSAAEQFIDKFAGGTHSISRIGYVAFNTNAHEIFPLSSCDTTAEASTLKNLVRSRTAPIIGAAGYKDSHNRFTNIEGGLKMAQNMLAGSSSENKYIIFLSDGFPTTYCQPNSTNGYDPYTPSGTKGADGVFYDYVTGYYCSYGTSYSDKAAIRARQTAEGMKSAGIKIFSIGIDVGGQTIAGYDGREGLSVIDRTSRTYDLGSATDPNAFKDWLGSSIGSGYYYDSTDSAGLLEAYDQIFREILMESTETSQDQWITKDPMPVAVEEDDRILEFIGFYDLYGNLQVAPEVTALVGSNTLNGENTAYFDLGAKAIAWDLKHSGYQSAQFGNYTSYMYHLRYRVRLQNESGEFVELADYLTNAPTYLDYQIVTTYNGVESFSEPKRLDFPIPVVEGYLGELSFTKMSPDGAPVAGAEFTLAHDTARCGFCRGDGRGHVVVFDTPGEAITAVSGDDGIVTFTGVPSGHTYSLVESKVPDGFWETGCTWMVDIRYDTVTVTQTNPDGTQDLWTIGQEGEEPFHIINNFAYRLPDTGGTGILPYVLGGLLLAAAPLKYASSHRDRKRRNR